MNHMHELYTALAVTTAYTEKSSLGHSVSWMQGAITTSSNIYGQVALPASLHHHNRARLLSLRMQRGLSWLCQAAAS